MGGLGIMGACLSVCLSVCLFACVFAFLFCFLFCFVFVVCVMVVFLVVAVVMLVAIVVRTLQLGCQRGVCSENATKSNKNPPQHEYFSAQKTCYCPVEFVLSFRRAFCILSHRFRALYMLIVLYYYY